MYNRERGNEHVVDWPLAVGDVRDIDWTPFRGSIDLLAGGPPCQPFAIGGKHAGHKDARDMWPEAVRAVEAIRPRAFLFENVRNFAGPKFSGYLRWVIESLRRPGVRRRSNENHHAHLDRLRISGGPPDYRVAWQVVCAADFGGPQIRHRVIVVGFDARLDIQPDVPPPTHTRDRLLWDQYVTGIYWQHHRMRPRVPISKALRSRVARLKANGAMPAGKPWVTVRDALAGLGEPNGRANHVLQPGARTYPGHTGSSLDMPSKALKAGDHGVPGGENMAIMDDGGVRYFSTREAARLVGLPDNYLFPGSWTESMRQLGNAVPTQLGEVVARFIRRQLRAAACETDFVAVPE